MNHAKLEKFLSELNSNFTRDFEVEDTLKSAIVAMSVTELFNYRSYMNHDITPTFDINGYLGYCFDKVDEFTSSINSSTEYLFIVYFDAHDVVHGRLFESAYITFFKPSDRSSFMEVLSSKIVEKVLNS